MYGTQAVSHETLVSTPYQGQHLGQRLLQHVIAELTQQPAITTLVGVPYTPRSERFMLREGFRHTGSGSMALDLARFRALATAIPS
jgi:GNAT superfamily N-acetyltransferase